MYALIEFKGKQYRIEKGTVLKTELVPQEPGSKLDVDSVLLVSGDVLKVGAPYVAGAKASFSVQSHEKDKKVIVFKYKPKKDYRRKRGHRQPYSVLKVEDISV
ncbi:MAG: 50S ribosomal protein L21 [Spirochaetaceae bacterium]|jgi:large subunit ribosomal protein L21|nr:50S ribosomal protein L21 [Spirochaetaceae bacterium]